MKSLKYLFLGMLILGSQSLRADEGMWIPMLIEKYHIDDMQAAGLKLNAEDIYSINQACLKDAIVLFGRGCTGEMISGEGLLLTNHHCGEGAIQSHSTVEQDYLTKGYWAKSRDEELPNEGLSVSYLRYMKDVSSRVMEGLEQGMDPLEQKALMDQNRGELVQEATRGTNLNAEVKSFYYGNAYYLFVYERFNDVRLVGAPPSAIGNFGLDHDNWMWPRHTGDFSLFRVYADADNQPAAYNPENKPYKPLKHLEINLDGIQEGDFTMILGYPASTTQYLHSEAVSSMVESSLPLKVDLRTARLEIMDHYMKESEVVRIQYAHKYRRVSNAWKKWQGMILGLSRNDVVDLKKDEESLFQDWVNQDDIRRMKYEDLLQAFDTLYGELNTYTVANDLFNEGLMAVELFEQVIELRSLLRRGVEAEQLEARSEKFFKDYYLPVDRDIFAEMMRIYREHMPADYYPEFFDHVNKKFKGDFGGFAENVFEKSLLARREDMARLVDVYRSDAESAREMLDEDPMAVYLDQFREIYRLRVSYEYGELSWKEEGLYKRYMAGLLEMAGQNKPYPDANRTMRLTYGKVEGYSPKDGVDYHYVTSMTGLMEKNKKGKADYMLPEKLVSLYEAKDFGPYGVNGTMPVNFIASNHTSGGNSGSPVLDAHGRLIGLNFDREWEGTMSDVFYDPQLCRNIAVDIRYVLFIIDKFAGATYLVEEMDIYSGEE